jgi:hypothetical protein
VQISDNHISGWSSAGIVVQGLPEVEASGVAVHGNVLSGLAHGGGIHLVQTRRALCSANTIGPIITGAGHPAIWLEGAPGQRLEAAVVSGNQIGGGSGMGHGLRLDHCTDCNATNNRIGPAGTSPVGAYDVTGELVLTGTSGFPRAGQGSPAGSLTAYFAGELYWEQGRGRWWTATAGGSTAWAAQGA